MRSDTDCRVADWIRTPQRLEFSWEGYNATPSRQMSCARRQPVRRQCSYFHQQVAVSGFHLHFHRSQHTEPLTAQRRPVYLLPKLSAGFTAAVCSSNVEADVSNRSPATPVRCSPTTHDALLVAAAGFSQASLTAAARSEVQHR